MLNALGPEVELIIPQVVIWEWAEHAAKAIDELREENRTFRVDAGLYEQPSLCEAPNKAQLVDQIAKSLPRFDSGVWPKSVWTWQPADEDYRHAVRSQVLQIGTAELKSGVKTGAADYLVLACVRAQIGDRATAEPVILASDDKHLRHACREEFGSEVLTAGNERDLLH